MVAAAADAGVQAGGILITLAFAFIAGFGGGAGHAWVTRRRNRDQ